MVVALPAGHPLASRKNGRGLTLKSLAHEKFIGYPRAAGAGLYDSVIAACIASGFSPDIAHEAPQIVTTLNLVAAGMGISVVPSSMQRLRLDAVVYRPMSGPHIRRASSTWRFGTMRWHRPPAHFWLWSERDAGAIRNT